MQGYSASQPNPAYHARGTHRTQPHTHTHSFSSSLSMHTYKMFPRLSTQPLCQQIHKKAGRHSFKSAAHAHWGTWVSSSSVQSKLEWVYFCRLCLFNFHLYLHHISVFRANVRINTSCMSEYNFICSQNRIIICTDFLWGVRCNFY